MKQIAVLSAATLMLASGAFAQSEDPAPVGITEVLTEMSLNVLNGVDETLSKHLDDTHKAVLISLAQQQSVASNCDGFEMNIERYTAEMGYVLDFLGSIDDEGKREDAKLATMMGFAAIVGGQDAIAAFDPERFCRNAAEEADDDTAPHMVLKQAQ